MTYTITLKAQNIYYKTYVLRISLENEYHLLNSLRCDKKPKLNYF